MVHRTNKQVQLHRYHQPRRTGAAEPEEDKLMKQRKFHDDLAFMLRSKRAQQRRMFHQSLFFQLRDNRLDTMVDSEVLRQDRRQMGAS
jgi:hypothetical protein